MLPRLALHGPSAVSISTTPGATRDFHHGLAVKLRLRPSHTEARERLAELLFQTGRDDEGLAHYLQLSRPTDWPPLVHMAGVAAWWLGRVESAAALLRQFFDWQLVNDLEKRCLLLLTATPVGNERDAHRARRLQPSSTSGHAERRPGPGRLGPVARPIVPVTARGEPGFLEALQALTDALGELPAPAMVIGGVAVIARGVPRSTVDIDATVNGQIKPFSSGIGGFCLQPHFDGAATPRSAIR